MKPRYTVAISCSNCQFVGHVDIYDLWKCDGFNDYFLVNPLGETVDCAKFFDIDDKWRAIIDRAEDEDVSISPNA